MAFTLGDRPVRPLTADEVLRMVEAGILGEDRRVELLHGVLTEVSPKSPQHAAIKGRIVRWLDAAVTRCAVRIEDPLVVPDRTSLPEPDIAVVEPGDLLHEHPGGALLVIQVASSSLAIDTQIKPDLYAAAGVPPARSAPAAARPRAGAAERVPERGHAPGSLTGARRGAPPR